MYAPPGQGSPPVERRLMATVPVIDPVLGVHDVELIRTLLYLVASVDRSPAPVEPLPRSTLKAAIPAQVVLDITGPLSPALQSPKKAAHPPQVFKERDRQRPILSHVFMAHPRLCPTHGWRSVA
jgi:hypothetical protein